MSPRLVQKIKLKTRIKLATFAEVSARGADVGLEPMPQPATGGGNDAWPGASTHFNSVKGKTSVRFRS